MKKNKKANLKLSMQKENYEKPIIVKISLDDCKGVPKVFTGSCGSCGGGCTVQCGT